MPDAARLTILADLRNAANVTLAQMATACGLKGRTAYESASAWEQGSSVPRSRVRHHFLNYLATTLGLASDLPLLKTVWSILVEEWGWEPLTARERDELGAKYAVDLPTSSSVRSMRQARAPGAVDLPAPVALPPGSRMPFARNPFFVGRTDDLQALAAALAVPGVTAISEHGAAAVIGMGGVGKSQLAVEFVHRYGARFLGGVFWCSFADGAGVAAEVAACGGPDHLGLHPEYERLALDDQVRLVREAWAQATPRLLVFDNCEDTALLAAWLPNTGGCRVLVTSQRSAWPAHLRIQTLPLSTLPRRASIDLLRCHRPDLSPTDPDLVAVAATLEDLPLALHLAGRYLAQGGSFCSPKVYLSTLHAAEPSALIDLAHPSLTGDARSPTGHIQHMARTFAVSYEQLSATDPVDMLALAIAMRTAALAPGELIELELLRLTLPEPLRQREAYVAAVRRLVDLGLIESVGSGGAVRLHRLIVAFLRTRPDLPAAQADVERAIIERAHQLNLNCDQQELMRLQVHLRAVTETALLRADSRAAALSFELSRHLGEIEHYEAAMHYNARSLVIRTHLFGEGDLSTAENLHYQGEMLDWLGAYQQARPSHERGLAIRLSVLGADHPDTATSMLHAGEIAHALCDYSVARAYYEQALNIRARLFGAESSAAAELHNNLGLLLNAMGEYVVAQPHAERAVAIWDGQAQPNRSRQATALNNLGYLLRARGQYHLARPILEQALAIREGVYGPYNTLLGITLNHLGRIAHYLGYLQEARRTLTQALTIFQMAIGLEHPITASTISNLGMVDLDEGELSAARARLEQALEVHQRRCGETHRHTARGINRLGLVHHAAGNLERSTEHFAAALAIRVDLLGPDHHDTANTRSHLGMLDLEHGAIAAARQRLSAALSSHQLRLGAHHPYTLRSLLRFALLLQSEGNEAEARQVWREAYMGYAKTLGPDHPFTAQATRAGAERGLT